MSWKKNITDGPRDVPLLNRVVAPGEVVEVPDFQPGHDPKAKEGEPGYLPIVWPDAVWQDVPDPSKTAKTAAKEQ